MLEKYSIRTQIMGTFIVFSTVFLLVTSSMAVSNINGLSGQTRVLSQDSLEQQALENIKRAASDTATIVQRKLERAMSVIDALAQGMEDIFSDKFTFDPEPGYLDYNSSTLPPDTAYNNRYRTEVSTTHSAFYYPGSHPDNLTDGSITDEMWDVINRSRNLDVLFTNLWNSNPDFAWLYAGFQTEGIFRIFPGSTVDTSREYDPRVRIWYTTALGGSGKIITTDPYLDALGQGWMISIAKAVYDSDNNLVGVVSGDLTLGTIQSIVNSVSIFESGYTSLVLNDGTVLAHPDLGNGSSTLESIDDLEFDGKPMWDMIMSIEDGSSVRYSKGGDEYIVSVASVLDKYKVMAIISEEEAFRAINGIDSKIEANQGSVFQATVLISIVTLIVVVGVGLYMSNSIVKPLDHLSRMAMRISQNITSDDIFAGVEVDESMVQDDEIGDLTRSFTSMVRSLREEEKKKKGK